MKKTVIIIFGLILILLTFVWLKYRIYQQEQNDIKAFNMEYETYLNKQITGTEITTAINRAVDINTTNSVTKDEQGFFIQNDVNSIEIEIKIIDLDDNTIYKMETLYGGGMKNFISHYSEIKFECTKIEYNKLGKVCYVLFEQRTT